jgi:hypothetical protein
MSTAARWRSRNDGWAALRWRSRRPARGRVVLLGRTVEAVVLVPALVGLVPAAELALAGLVPAPELALDAAPLAPLGRVAATDALDPLELDWLGGGLPIGRFAGGVPARCWRRRLALLTWVPR